MSFFKKMVDKFEDLVTDDDKKKSEKKKEEEHHEGISYDPLCTLPCQGHCQMTSAMLTHAANRHERLESSVQPARSLQPTIAIWPSTFTVRT